MRMRGRDGVLQGMARAHAWYGVGDRNFFFRDEALPHFHYIERKYRVSQLKQQTRERGGDRRTPRSDTLGLIQT